MHKYLILLFCAAFLGCETYEPPDPNGPNGSWWVGGLDGGVYVFIEDDANPSDNIYQGSIYFDADKTIWYQGRFRYSQNTRLDYKNKAIYSGWDGERLLLKDQSYLQAMEEIPLL